MFAAPLSLDEAADLLGEPAAQIVPEPDEAIASGVLVREADFTDLPHEIRTLMSLYPQPRGRQPSVEYVPAPAASPDGQPRRRWVPSPQLARPAGR